MAYLRGGLKRVGSAGGLSTVGLPVNALAIDDPTAMASLVEEQRESRSSLADEKLTDMEKGHGCTLLSPLTLRSTHPSSVQDTLNVAEFDDPNVDKSAMTLGVFYSYCRADVTSDMICRGRLAVPGSPFGRG